MTNRVALLLLLSAVIGRAQIHQNVFEEVEGTSRSAWRSRSAGAEMLVVPGGFILRDGKQVRRFRWDRTMRLQSLVPEQPVESNSYILLRRGSRRLEHAQRIRAVSEDHRISVVYYFGARGLEFDIELDPGARVSSVGLESLDDNFSISARGSVAVGNKDLALKPVAYNVGPGEQRRLVLVHYRMDNPRHLSFDIGPHNSHERLLIDPVMTYVTYFGDAAPVGIRELPDGSVLLVGNATAVNLPPHAESLTTLLVGPSELDTGPHCFVARVVPAKKEVLFDSFLGGDSESGCSAMDVDSTGRIILTGVSYELNITTPDAEDPNGPGAFLARISADGKTLDYSTFLNISANRFMKVGPDETVYLAEGCPAGTDSSGSTYINPCFQNVPRLSGGYEEAPAGVLVLRYNLAQKQFDRLTYFAGVILDGIQLSGSGNLYLFGQGVSQNLPLQNPIQATPPTSGKGSGYVAELSSDLSTLLFGSYLGGQNGDTSIQFATPNSDGTVWLDGLASTGSIAGLEPAIPLIPPYTSSPFAVLIKPGVSGYSEGILAGGYAEDLSGGVSATVQLANGAHCLVFMGSLSESIPGGTALNNGAHSVVPMLGCLNADGNNFEQIGPIGKGTSSETQTNLILASSAAGGVWTLVSGEATDSVPYDFKPAAIQPYQPTSNGGAVLRYIDLGTPTPVLVNPQPLNLFALRSNTTDSVNLSGRNFAEGMQLSIDGTPIAVTPTGPTTATLSYVSPDVGGPVPGQTLNVAAGNYTGQLVIPTQPPVMSDPFPVVVQNLAPAPQPFASTSDPHTFLIALPVYDDSQVLWNGTPATLIPPSGQGGSFQVQLPAGASGSGNLTLINPSPGGGVAVQPITIGRYVQAGGCTPAPSIAADFYQVDRTNGLLYTLTGLTAPQWTLSKYSVPGGSLIQSSAIAKNGATRIIDFRLSRDGSYVYLLDDQHRVSRFRTDTFQQDLQFSIPVDAIINAVDPSGLRVLDDASKSVVVITPAGRLIIYDDAQPRPYTTSDFPSAAVPALDPVLSTNSYVYAVPRADVYHESPCVVRFPVDELGFGPPEEFCNPGDNWGKYPEMKIYNGSLALENTYNSYGILLQPDTFGNMVSSVYYDPHDNLAVTPAAATFTLSTMAATYRLAFSNLDSGQSIGYYPPGLALCVEADTVVVLDDGSIVFSQIGRNVPSSVSILPQWQTAIQNLSVDANHVRGGRRVPLNNR